MPGSITAATETLSVDAEGGDALWVNVDAILTRGSDLVDLTGTTTLCGLTTGIYPG